MFIKFVQSLKLVPFFLVLITACKKKEETKPRDAVNNSSTTDSLGIYGNFQSSYYTYDYGNGQISNDSVVMGSFYNSHYDSTSIPATVNIGSLLVNFFYLNFATPENVYMQYNPPVSINQVIYWQVVSTTRESFTYYFIPVYPYLNSPFALPDTCLKSNGITIPLTDIRNTNFPTKVTISQGTNAKIMKTIRDSTATVSFTPSELAGFSINSQFTIQISVYRVKRSPVGPISYQFTTSHEYFKYCYLK